MVKRHKKHNPKMIKRSFPKKTRANSAAGSRRSAPNGAAGVGSQAGRKTHHKRGGFDQPCWRGKGGEKKN